MGAATISGTTKLIGIIGDPVTHSLSPVMHNAAFAALGLDLVYVPLHVRSSDLAAAVSGLRALGFRGVNVTVPHKGAVADHLTWTHEDARLTEAVNTVVVEGAATRGYNTDVAGVRDALGDACGDSLAGAPGLVLGAGGAARAAALALARMGVSLTVVGRTPARAEHVQRLVVAAVPQAICRWLPLTELTPAVVASQRLLLNATTLGMAGAGKVPAVMADNVTAGQVVFDAVYGSGPTELLVKARERGATVVDGRSMLVRQAAASFELWTGMRAPVEVMRDAVA